MDSIILGILVALAVWLFMKHRQGNGGSLFGGLFSGSRSQVEHKSPPKQRDMPRIGTPGTITDEQINALKGNFFEPTKKWSFEEAALIEPLSVGIHVARRANIQRGDRVVILGAGPIGIMCLETSLIRGALEVTVTDVVDFRLAKAEDLGATEIINVKTASTELYAKTFDKVIQTAGTSETYGQGLALAARGGRIVQVGHPFAQHVPIDASLLISKELDMVGSYRYTNTYPEAISLINARKVHLKPLISKSFSLEEVKKALEYPKQHPDSCIKAVVRF